MPNNVSLAETMNRSVKRLISDARKASLKNPKESVFLFHFLIRSKWAEKNRMNHEKRSQHIPPFLIASITSSCNLFCKGCYAREIQADGEPSECGQLSCAQWGRIFSEAKKLGVSFILLAGGEPLLRKDVLECAGGCQGILFPVFTNGTMIKEDYLLLFDRKRNLLPVLSLEGGRAATDGRRGEGVYDLLTGVMRELNARGIFYGVSITVTTENVEAVTDEAFAENLLRRGCKVVFYVEYVPVAEETASLAPGPEEREMLQKRQDRLRRRFPGMIFLAFPGDEAASGGCLAAGRGFFHINARGGAEPCPFSPYSDVNLKDVSLLEALDSGLFHRLREAGILPGEHKGGCVLFEREAEVKRLLSPEREAQKNR